MFGIGLMTPYRTTLTSTTAVMHPNSVTPPPSRKGNIADAFFSSDEEAENSYNEEVLATQEAKQVETEKLRCSTFCESLLDESAARVAKLAPREPGPESAAEAFTDTEVNPALSWNKYQVHLHRDEEWWNEERGIVDLRLWFMDTPTQSEGIALRNGLMRMNRALGKRQCFFKVGIGHDLATRWELYQVDNNWKPTHLFILTYVANREAASFVESCFILENMSRDSPANHNMNLMRGDKGGTGPRRPVQYYVYVAVSPTAD